MHKVFQRPVNIAQCIRKFHATVLEAVKKTAEKEWQKKTPEDANRHQPEPLRSYYQF